MSRLTAPVRRSRAGKRRFSLRVGPLIPRRYLPVLGLLAVAALVGLIAILSPRSQPSPHAPAINAPTVRIPRPLHLPSIPSPSIPDIPSPSIPGVPSLDDGGPPASVPAEPDRVYRVSERDVETHRVTVSEATVHHPHHASVDLSLLALAALTVLSPFFLKRRRLVPRRLRPFVWPLALSGVLTLAVLSVHVWESPKPPKLVSLHTIRFHPELIPQGVETHREGNTIHVIHRFRRNVPERKLLHVHVWMLKAAWQWPLLLSAALAALLVGDRLVPLRKPGRGPPTTPVLETANREPRRI